MIILPESDEDLLRECEVETFRIPRSARNRTLEEKARRSHIKRLRSKPSSVNKQGKVLLSHEENKGGLLP